MKDLNRRFWPAALVVLSLGAAPAFAQHEQGDVSLGGYGMLMFQKAGDTTFKVGFVGAQFGKFITSEREVGALTQLTFTSGAGTSSVSGRLGGYGKQYFGQDKTRPYLGAQVVLDMMGAGGQETTTGLGLTATAGVRHYLSRNGALWGELDYGVRLGGAAEGESSFNFDSFPQLVFGFSIIF